MLERKQSDFHGSVTRPGPASSPPCTPAHHRWRHNIEVRSAFFNFCTGIQRSRTTFPLKWPVLESLDIFIAFILNKLLNIRSSCRLFGTCRSCDITVEPGCRYIPIFLICLYLCGLMSDQRMMTSSNGNIIRVTGPLCGEFAGQWREFLKFSLIFA